MTDKLLTPVFPRLPHGAPFLLLDRVIEVRERDAVFSKLLTATDPCLAPDGTLPAAFVLEAIAQAGGALLGELEGRATPSPGYLAAVDGFVLREPVRVGDALRIEVHLVRHVAHASLLRGRVLVDGAVRAEGRVTLALPR